MGKFSMAVKNRPQEKPAGQQKPERKQKPTEERKPEREQKAEQRKPAGERLSGLEQAKSGYAAFKRILGKIIMVLYHLRKVVLAAPVVYAALRLAAYNASHLPESVGLNLQTNGEFAMEIARSAAVMGPLVLTGACLLLMFCSRKAMYAWAISIFTLAVPVLLLVSNLYPA